MKNLISILLFMLSIDLPAQNEEFTYGKSVNKFAFDYFESLNKDKKNTIFSPYSISAALSMTYMGAEKKTERDMAKVLHLTENKKLMADMYAEYNRSINSPFISENITLKNANSLWGEKSYPFKKEYIETIEEKFGAPFKQVSFINETEKCRKEINKWVEKNTEKKIVELIPKNVLSANTRLVLANAVYFYGGWAKEFKKNSTKEQEFFLSEEKSVKSDFLNKTEKLYYFENELFKAVEIPYKGKAASLMVFIPKNKTGFNNLCQTLDFKTYEEWNSKMKPAMVKLSIPKFKVEAAFELSDALSKMGMKTAFTTQANFQGMSSKDDLKIDKVLHKATIEIDEQGTEAAAATAVVMVRKTSIDMDLDLVEFTADRPFVFLLKENQNQSILFMGKVTNPK